MLGKVLMVTHDHRSSDICSRMAPIYENKSIPLDELFHDKVTGKSWISPPFIPNCYDDKTEVLTSKGWKLFKDVEWAILKLVSIFPLVSNRI